MQGRPVIVAVAACCMALAPSACSDDDPDGSDRLERPTPSVAEGTPGEPGPDVEGQDMEPPGVRGVLVDRSGTRERDDDEPVAGARIEVLTESGAESIAEVVSDADGEWFIPVPGSDRYLVRLDTGTLPAGLAYGQIEYDVEVDPGQTRFVIFPLGGRQRGG